jgi:hypothetical protein
MRYLLLFLLLLVVCVAAVGFNRGWFSVKTETDPETGKQGVQFEMDRSKIAPDIEKVKEKVGAGSAQTGDKPQSH